MIDRKITTSACRFRLSDQVWAQCQPQPQDDFKAPCQPHTQGNVLPSTLPNDLSNEQPQPYIFDTVLPAPLLERLQLSFQPPTSHFWTDHRYFDQEETPYFSYLYNLVGT